MSRLHRRCACPRPAFVLLPLLFAFTAFSPLLRAQNVVINEIMYHPLSHIARDEWVELHNRETTNVNVSGWQLTRGINFTFPSNTIVPAGGYLVVAAQKASFQALYPGVTNVVGDYVVMRTTNLFGNIITNWANTLSNTRDEIELENASGGRIDLVEYAEEGDWAQRQRGLNDLNHRGWIWYAPHDGLGHSLELRNAALPNEHGQNWGASQSAGGTPGAANSVATVNIPPMILDVAHFPIVPRSTESVSVTARILNESAQNVTVRLHWRADAATPPPFTASTMFDDGAHGDGLAGDGIYAFTIPAQPDGTVIEFYVHATDAEGNARSWPAPALPAADSPGGPATNAANALFQFDNNPANAFGGVPSQQPVYKMILTEAERAELQGIPQSNSRQTDAQMNVTFISLDARGTEMRYTAGVRNRGNSSRGANPPNYRVNFPADRPWYGAKAINLNTVQVHLQHFGSTLAIKSGAVGPYSRAVQVRVNNVDRAVSGNPMFGSYAANEVFNSDWAETHFPSDSGGNAYKAQRNFDPSEFDYRGENPSSYQNTYFKETNVSENDWRDLIVMHSVMGLNGIVEYDATNVRRVINPEQWLTHLAVMSLVGNSESGLNSGHNDDYSMYRGVDDPRFILVYHDLDQLFGLGGQAFPPNDTIWGATYRQGIDPCCRSTGDNDGSGNMMNRFMRTPEFEALYYATLQRLLDTTFSKAQFDALLDQTLTYVPSGTINTIKSWMDSRRTYVQSVINGFVPPKFIPPVATISGEPRDPSPSRNASLTVGGVGISHYRFRLNNGAYSAETPVGTAITLSNLPDGSTNTVFVIGKSTNGTWQSASAATASRTWVVRTSTPTVRLNEVLASNNGALTHSGTTPDAIELFNDGTAAVDLSGLRLTDNKDEPAKFTFPAGTTLAAGAYLTVYANNPDGTPGLHTGFTLDPDGDQVYLFDRVANGNVVLDSVRFGIQITDLSLGRVNGGTWTLVQPSFGAANTALPLASDSQLKINEWLAAGGAAGDFIEVYNPSAQPVALGGLYLTDNAIGAPARHRLADLSFIAANGFVSLIADGDDDKPNHVGFQLSSDVGEIALASAILQPIDCVVYGPQRLGVSMGCCPDGSVTNRFLSLPTPGSINACPVAPPAAQTVTLMAFVHPFRYEQSGSNLGTAWIAPGYNDSAWPSGLSFLATPNQGGNQSWGVPVNTPLSVNSSKITFYFRTTFTNQLSGPASALQIDHLIDDGAVFYLNGQELYRYNMPAGTITASTLASQNILPANFSGPITLPASLLQAGVNHLAVEVHQAGVNSVDIGLGFTLSAIIATNSAASAGVVISEVLADNASQADADGSTPDWIEIYNPSQTTVDLADMSLTDSTAEPRRWVFPSGSIVPAQGFFRVRFDADRPASATNTGWGLNANGDTVYLYNTPASGGGLRDAITFGLQIPDFSIARLPNGSNTWNLALPTIGSGNLAATLGNATALRINEWMANPVPGEDDYIELFNTAAQPVALSGLWLTDDLSVRNKHQIAPLSFIGAVTNAWREFKADGNTASGAHHVGFSLRGSGEAVGLSLANLTLIDSITFGAQSEGVSQGRLPDGAGNVVSFVGTASPGGANFLLLTNIVINEVLTHSDLPLEDAIELRNLTGIAVDLSGWWLSDARSEPQKYQLPPGTTIPAHGFRVFYENQFNSPDVAIVPFSLSSAKGDQVYLSAATTGGALTGYRTFVEFGPAENGVSFGRYVNSTGTGEFTALSARTFGVDNPSTVTQFRTGTGRTNAYPKVGPVVFSEVMYHPPALGTNDNTRDEFLELRNITGAPVPLYDPNFPTNRWRIRGGVDFDFPAFVSIPAGGSIVVVSFDPAANSTDAAAFRSAYGLAGGTTLYGPWTGKLDNGGERIELRKPDAPQTAPSPDAGLVPYVTVDLVTYDDVAPWPTSPDGFGMSLHRLSQSGYANDPTNWFAANPTPMSSTAGSGDTDGDGMPDNWEQTYGFNPNDSTDASQDADSDGMTNLQEFRAGTNPRSASSRLAMAISLTPSNAARLQFSAASNVSYTVQHRAALGVGSWQHLQSVTAAPSNRTVTITNPVPGTTRFYRVVVP